MTGRTSVSDLDAPQHLTRLRRHDVSRAVPRDPPEELCEVPVVAEPGAACEQVDGVYDLLLAGRHDQLLVVSPHLQQAGHQALGVERGHQVAVDVPRQVRAARLALVLFGLGAVFTEIDSWFVNMDNFNSVVCFIFTVIIFVRPDVIIIVVIIFVFCLKDKLVHSS